MNRRTHESPMDFEWQTAGPADPTSPFHQVSVQHQEEQRKRERHGQKRSHSVYDSPVKPSAPQPPSQSFDFNPPSPAKNVFPPHLRNKPSFTTPRKFETDLYSSGPEISSPENNADAEDTPDRPSQRPWLTLDDDDDDDESSNCDGNGKRQRPKKRSSIGEIFGIYGRIRNSPGRGEVRRGNRFSEAIARKIRKRRRPQDVDRETRFAPAGHTGAMVSTGRSSDYPESDLHMHSVSTAGKGQEGGSGSADSSQSSNLLSAVFGWMARYPTFPHTLIVYTQVFFNAFLVFTFIYFVYSLWATIRNDVDNRSKLVVAETMAEMAVCARQFVENKCDRATRVPAMETICENWEVCMKRDPSSVVGRARVSAQMFAEIFNSFVEPISYKAMIFMVVFVFSVVAACNLFLTYVRTKSLPLPHPSHVYLDAQHYQHQQQHIPAAITSRSASFGLGQGQGQAGEGSLVPMI